MISIFRSCLVALFVLSVCSQAATDDSTKFINIYVGAGVAGKAGVNTKVADGFKSDVNFNSVPELYATALFAFGKRNNIGLGLDVGMNSLSFISKPDVNIRAVTDDNIIKEQYSYIGIFPHLFFSGFVVGCNIGLPSSASTVSKSGTDVSVLYPGVPMNPPAMKVDYSSLMNTMFELKLGGRLPVSDDALGRLNIDVMLGYSLTHIYADGHNYYGSYNNDGKGTVIYNSDDNPLPVSLSLGISYQFRFAISTGK